MTFHSYDSLSISFASSKMVIAQRSKLRHKCNLFQKFSYNNEQRDLPVPSQGSFDRGLQGGRPGSTLLCNISYLVGQLTRGQVRCQTLPKAQGLGSFQVLGVSTQLKFNFARFGLVWFGSFELTNSGCLGKFSLVGLAWRVSDKGKQ